MHSKSGVPYKFRSVLLVPKRLPTPVSTLPCISHMWYIPIISEWLSLESRCPDLLGSGLFCKILNCKFCCKIAVKEYEWMMHLYSAFCVLLYTQSALQSCGGGGGVSPQPSPVCRIHLDDATAATVQRRQCAHHTPATGGEERES